MAEADTNNQTPDIVMVDSRKLSCDGGGGALGHPVVWYEMVGEDSIQCKYCDRLFILRGGKQDPNT